MSTYQDMIALAQSAAKAYYDGEDSVISDDEYDTLLDRIRAHESANPAEVVDHGLFTVVAAGVSDGGDVKHATPMLSLNKVLPEQWEDLGKFIDRVADEDDHATIQVEPKFDGMAMSVVYEGGKAIRAVTRGDGRAGEDVTSRMISDPQVKVVGLPSVIDGFTGELRGEALLSYADMAWTNERREQSGKEPYKKIRSATAGIVRAKTLTHDARIHFVTYDILTDDERTPGAEHGIIPSPIAGGIKKCSFAAGSNETIITTVFDYIEEFGNSREDYEFPIDGMVLKVVDESVRDNMGASSRHPRWAVAYKFPPLKKQSILRDIIVEVGRTGNLSFTAVFDPVVLSGSDVDHASVHNPDIIRALTEDGGYPHIGDSISVYLALDIIPQIAKSSAVRSDESEAEAWNPPTADADGYEYDTGQAIWRSTNPSTNLGALLVYATSRDALDVDTFGSAVAVMLVACERVHDVADIFTLDESIARLPYKVSVREGLDIALDEFDYLNPDVARFDVEEFGEKRTATLLANIEKARSQPLNRFITSLGIRSVGRTFGRRIANEMHTFENILAATANDLRGIEGIATTDQGDTDRATLFYAGFQDNRAVIEKFASLGIVFDEPEDDGAVKVLDGMSVCATGSTKGTRLGSYARNEINELIEKHGGRASSGVSKSTNLLVAGEGAGSKLANAQKFGTKVVTPDEFAEMLGL